MIHRHPKIRPNALSNRIPLFSPPRRSAVLAAVTLATLLFVSACECRQAPKQIGPEATDPGPSEILVPAPAEEVEQCGHCLDFPLGEVCTPDGTVRNSCMAICRSVEILCSEACPCPEEE